MVNQLIRENVDEIKQAALGLLEGIAEAEHQFDVKEFENSRLLVRVIMANSLELLEDVHMFAEALESIGYLELEEEEILH